MGMGPRTRSRRRADFLRTVAVAMALLAASTPLAVRARTESLTDARERLSALEGQIAAQEAALASTHADLDALQSRISGLEAEHTRTQLQLLGTERALADANARYRVLQDKLAQAARLAYQWGPLAPVEAALGAESLADLSDRLEYFDSIAQANVEIANGVAARAAELASIRAGLRKLSEEQAARELELDHDRASLEAAYLDQQSELTDLAAAREQAARLVARLEIVANPDVVGACVPFGRWAELFLSRLGAPICLDNLTVVVAWETAEGTAAAYNPLATTHVVPGSTAFNAVGVQNYPSLGDGIQASIDTLALGSPTYGYGTVLANLGACSRAETTALAINASAWCRGCAGGGYVVDVVPLVRADYEAFASR